MVDVIVTKESIGWILAAIFVVSMIIGPFLSKQQKRSFSSLRKMAGKHCRSSVFFFEKKGKTEKNNYY